VAVAVVVTGITNKQQLLAALAVLAGAELALIIQQLLQMGRLILAAVAEEQVLVL
jgi:hypothetical protein